MGKSSLIATAAVTIALLAVPFTGASAGDDSGGYNSSDTDTVTIGSDPNTGGATQGLRPDAVDPARDRRPQTESRLSAGQLFA
jgi:hypothetical protein